MFIRQQGLYYQTLYGIAWYVLQQHSYEYTNQAEHIMQVMNTINVVLINTITKQGKGKLWPKNV